MKKDLPMPVVIAVLVVVILIIIGVYWGISAAQQKKAQENMPVMPPMGGPMGPGAPAGMPGAPAGMPMPAGPNGPQGAPAGMPGPAPAAPAPGN